MISPDFARSPVDAFDGLATLRAAGQPADCVVPYQTGIHVRDIPCGSLVWLEGTIAGFYIGRLARKGPRRVCNWHRVRAVAGRPVVRSALVGGYWRPVISGDL